MSQNGNPKNAYRAKGYDNRYGTMIVNPHDDYSKWRFSTVLEEFAKYKGIQKCLNEKNTGRCIRGRTFTVCC